LPKNNDQILNFFNEHKNEPFEFIIVTDINLKQHPNYYKAVFKSIKTGTSYTTEITPEMMRYKYKIGHIYTNGERVGQNPSVLKAEFTVNENTDLKLERLLYYINEDEIKNITDYKGVYKYLLRQYAHVEKQDEFTLIIPCYTIANRFYFLSSSMKHAIMSSTLEELYYKGSFHHDINESGKTIVKLHIKKKAGKKDLPFICRFAGSTFAQNRLQYLNQQKSLDASREFQPIKAQFPVRNSFNIYASYIYIGDDIRGNPKYLVLNIHSENSPLGFSEIYYKQYSEKQDPKEIAPGHYAIPPRPKNKFKKKKPKRTNTIYTGIPSSEYLRYTLHTREEEYYKNDVSIYGSTIHGEGESNSELKVESSENKVGGSFESPSSSGDKNLGAVATSNDVDQKDKEKKIFNLNNFNQFYEALLSYAYVDGSELYGPFELDKIRNDKRKSVKSKSILFGNEDHPRRFLFGELSYNKKTIYIVEIEQDFTWGPSTWIFFTDENTQEYTEDNMKKIIEHYIQKNLKYTELAEYVKNDYLLYFAQKEHKNGDIDDDSIERWCESVLRKVL
jgi:hypothetical protein